MTRLLIIFFIICFHILPLQSQEDKKKAAAQDLDNKNEDVTVIRSREDILKQGIITHREPSFFEVWEFEMGFHFNPILPTGDLAKFLDMGYGGSFFATIDLPWINNSRFGVSAGFGTMKSSVSYFNATVTMMPVMAFYEFNYIFRNNLRPYIRIGGGLTFASFQGKSLADTESSSVSSFDPTLDFGVGLGYRIRRLPGLELVLYLNYFTAFENNAGNFIMISFGTNFIF